MAVLTMSWLWPLRGHTSSILLLLMIQSMLVQISWCNQGRVYLREKEKQILDQILAPEKYDVRILPFGANTTEYTTTSVDVNMFVRSISKIDDYKMEYSAQLTFRQRWIDERLKFNDFGGTIKYLILTDPTRIWIPDLFFANEREGHFHNIITPNVYIRIFPDGSVLFSIRVSLTLACPMNLKLYPFDRQICSLRMASYSWTTKDLEFVWKYGDPVQVVKDFHLPQFTLEKFLTASCNSKTSTGEYSCLKLELFFKRELFYYLIHIYIPCCMLVMVSWVSFWFDPCAISARVFLAVTTLFTTVIQISRFNSSLPPVSYIKAIDIWTGVCLTFVFGTLLQLATVSYTSKYFIRNEKLKKQKCQCEDSAPMEAAAELLEDGATNFAMEPLVQRPGDALTLEKVHQCEIHMLPKRENCCLSWLTKILISSKRIDVISRMAFPLAFALFNIVYWSIFLFPQET